MMWVPIQIYSAPKPGTEIWLCGFWTGPDKNPARMNSLKLQFKCFCRDLYSKTWITVLLWIKIFKIWWLKHILYWWWIGLKSLYSLLGSIIAQGKMFELLTLFSFIHCNISLALRGCRALLFFLFYWSITFSFVWAFYIGLYLII